MKKALLLFLSCILIASGTACNIPAVSTAEAPPAMQTAAAQTVQAVINNTPLVSPQASSVAQDTPAGGTPAKPTSTTGGSARLTVEDVTNCRSGPGTGYERITQIPAGKEVQVTGSYPGYWVVQSDAGACWIAMEFSTPAGDMAAVPTVTAPSTPENGDVKAPGLQRYDWYCNAQTNQADVSLRWTDKSIGESGYRIYVNDKVFVELPADTAQYSFSFELKNGQSATLYIAAFNEATSAGTSPITISC